MIIATSWLAITTGTDEEIVTNFASLLAIKASRQHVKIVTIPHRSVESASLAIKVRKPFVVSIDPDLPLREGERVTKWSGLNLLKVTNRLRIPSVLLTDSEKRQVQGALNQMKISEQPTIITNRSLPDKWANAMISQLMRRHQS